MASSGMKKFKKGEVVFKQGDSAACMYDVRWGSVGIYLNYKHSGEKQLSVVKTEEFFGEMGLIEGLPRSATAVALENDTQIEVITPDTFEVYFKDKPAKVLMIMQHMSQRLRALTGEYLDACRAVAEIEETAESGAEKSEWFKKNYQKFANDYKAGR